MKNSVITRRTFFKTTAIGSLACALPSCARGNTQNKPNVIWIVNDASRALNYSCYGYERMTSPNIDEWAERGTLFERTYSQAYSTTESVSTYMTGQYFPEWSSDLLLFAESVPLGTPKDEILAPKAFADNGYHTVFLSGNGAYVSNHCRLAKAFDEILIAKAEKFTPLNAESPRIFKTTIRSINEKILPWLKKNSSSPFFMYLHAMDSHVPFTIPNSAPFNKWMDKEYSPKSIKNFDVLLPHRVEKGAISDEDILYLKGLYDGCIRYADYHIGRFLHSLDQLGLSENTIVVYSSDHGEALFDDGITHGHNGIYGGADETHQVPLIMAGPGIPEGKRVEGQTQLIDILPTLIELCNLEVTGKLDGRSLVSEFRPSGEAIMQPYAVTKAGGPPHGDVGHLVLTGKNYKYRWNARGKKERLWAIPDRMAERADVVASNRSVAAQMHNYYQNELVPLINRAKEGRLPQIIWISWPTGAALGRAKGLQRVAQGSKTQPSTKDMSRWIYTKNSPHGSHIFCFPADDGPLFSLRIDYPFLGKYLIALELYAAEEDIEGPASTLEVSVDDSKFKRISSSPVDGLPGWEFVDLGSYTFHRRWPTLTFRGAKSTARMRSILFLPDMPGAREVAEKELLIGISQEEVKERQEALEALGYL